ncbi:MAG: prephenate dehydrogenase/arogenate dehydrogenase family protein [Anaerolineaceae bacterium]|nr:prephenate dehydrogenase/arogenate dehydrogenase family protein [Anaerolineaceae bacterium]
MTIQITLIGTGRVGTSIGLALANETDQLFRVGHDRDPVHTSKAQKMGALDKVHLNLHAAVKDADIVVLAIPVDEIHETLNQISEDLKESAVVLDTSAIKSTVSDWAKELLPAGGDFLTFALTLNPDHLLDTKTGPEAAHADLFKQGMAVITSRGKTSEEALTLTSNLAVLLGSRPFFVDEVEYEGLFAASGLLPQVNAAALVLSTTGRAGWQEGRKIAGQSYALATQPLRLMDDREKLGSSMLMNRENLVRVIDNQIQGLQMLRAAIESRDEEKLQDMLETVIDAHENWWEERNRAEWDSDPSRPEIPSVGEHLMHWVGLNPKKKKGKE